MNPLFVYGPDGQTMDAIRGGDGCKASTDGESRRASRLHPHLSRFRCQIGGEFAVRRRIVRKLGRIEDEINESGSDCLDSVIIG